MEVLRLLVVTVLMGGLCFRLVSGIAGGLRTGQIRYGRGPGQHFVHRTRQPLLFGFVVFVFAVFTLTSAGVIVWVVQKALFK